MLLRSSSTPSLTSWFQQHNPKGLSSSSREPDFIHLTLKSPTVSFNSPTKSTTGAPSEGDLVTLSPSSSRMCANCLISCAEVDEIENRGLMFTSSGLDGNGAGGGGGGGGKIGGGGGDNWDYDYGGDVYYRNMIEANPNNSLILGNYAKYLKEVRGDVVKAEEYCSRAILANTSDGIVLSMYADLIWETQNDASRAQSYFDQAVKASPDDSYVMAAYARFLWDADEEEFDTDLAASSFVTSQLFPIIAA